jgi:protein-tyrosine phosphatase
LELSQEGAAAELKNIQFIAFPIPDRGVPASTQDALSLLSNLAALLAEGKNVAVHCRQSVGRSGMVAAGLLVTSGISADEAIDVVGAARGQVIPETPEQLRWIKHLPSRHPALTSR